MFKRLIYLMMFVMALSSTAHAAVYLWSGSAADGLWETPANWTVTDSTWTWPNEESAADPNMAEKMVNADTLWIDILNGDAVTRGSPLAIQGAADGSTTGVLTLNNGSSLTVDGRLAIGGANDTRGQIDILGGSTVTILGDGSDLRVVDNENTWGTVNIIDSTVDISDDLYVDQGEGYINIGGSSTVNADVTRIADGAASLGYLDISGTATLTLRGDMETDDGEAHITISGNATVNIGDDLELANQPTGVATMDISGTATVTVNDDIDLGKKGLGTLNISGDATLDVPDEVYIADDEGSEGHMNISGNATVNVGDDIDVGDRALGTLNISENATVNISDGLYVAVGADSEGHLTISGNATVTIGDDLIIVNRGGTTGSLHISGNPTINIAEQFYMNDDDNGAPSTSQVIMDGGTVTIGSYCTFNDDNSGTAEFIMNGGSFYCADYLNLSDNLDGTAHLTMNGGEMITGNRLRLGKDGGEDTGQVRIFMNGGLLQAEVLSDIKITDTQIIYTGGVFRIGAASLDIAGMQQLITDGTLVIPDESLVYGIISNGIYTEINPNSPLIPQMPIPADGAEGVLYGNSLNWAPGDTAATNDVYFGTTNPPAFAASVEAEVGTYYPGPLEQGTTYYWQVDAVEADGMTKYSSDVWSFTATTDMKNIVLDIRIATGNDDVEERLREDRNGDLDMGSSDLEFPNEDFPHDDGQRVGMRFVNVGIPQGTEIASSYIEFEVDNLKGGTEPVNVIIDGQLTPDAEPFVDEPFNVSNRTFTTAIVPWSVPNWTEKNVKWQTPDISVLIQEILDQADWTFGNAMVFTIQDDPCNPSTGVREAESYNGEASAAPLLHIEAVVIEVATQPSPANGAEGVPLDATFGWWPGVNAVSHNVYLDTSAATSLAMPTTYLVDGDSHSLPWVVEDGTITFDGEIYDDGGDPDFISAGASGNTFDVPDLGNGAKLSFDFDVDSVEFIYGGNAGNITVEAKDKVGAVIDSFSQANTNDGEPAGPITLSGSGIRSLHWKTTSNFNKFAALDNIVLTILPPPALIGNTTQVGFDPGVLAPSTTYYWQIDTVEANGTIHTGVVWSFTTKPGEATQPDPADKAVGVALDKILSWKLGTTAATHDVYFGTTSPPPFIGNQAESSFDPGPLEMETTYYWQVNEIEADGTTVYTGDVWSFKTPRPGMGTILYEIWDGITGTSVSDLTDSPDYPYNSTSSTELSSFDAPVDRANDFGGRLHGYLHPETSGDYTFWIATDDNSELWLSTDDSSANAVLISTVSAWASHLNFDDDDVTPSGPIPLEGGQKYYIMALYKEGGGGDNCAVAWEGPDSPTRAVIAGYYLSPYVEFKATSPDPADGTIEVQKTVTLSWTPGGTAASHDVYLSADEQAVIDGTAPVTTVTEASYSPADLEKGVTYYWRVDEVEADGTTHTGDVWSFTVTTLGR
ncbi:MAG: hypothetical protein IIB56_05340 [Planctomycetes bacterium]|nr:hypothetical protein [Planctomycetota bacterium]